MIIKIISKIKVLFCIDMILLNIRNILIIIMRWFIILFLMDYLLMDGTLFIYIVIQSYNMLKSANSIWDIIYYCSFYLIILFSKLVKIIFTILICIYIFYNLKHHERNNQTKNEKIKK